MARISAYGVPGASGSSPITGTGVANQVAYFTSAGAITGSTGFTTDGSGKVTLTGGLILPDGALGAATAAIYFASDTNTGYYRIGTDRSGIIGNGKIQLDIDEGSLGLYVSQNTQYVIYKSGTGNASSVRLAGSFAGGGEFIGYGSGHATKAGIAGVTSTTATNASDVLTLLNGPAGKAGNPVGFLNVEVNGTTRVIPYW